MPPSPGRALRVASLIWGASILLSRVIGIIREGVLGRILGTSGDADVYLTAFNLGDFVNYALAGGAISLVFIPIFAGHLAQEDDERAWGAFSAIFNTLVALLVVLIPTLWVAAPQLTGLLAPGFDDAQNLLLVHLIRILLPAQVFHILGAVLSAALQARDRHGLAATSSLVYAVCIVLGGLIGQSAIGFAWGVLAGALIGPFGMPLYGNLRLGLRWRPGLNLSNPDLRRWFLRSLPIMLGLSIVVVDDWLLRRQGSLLGAGAIASLGYAKTLMKVPMGIFGIATGVAAYPTLSRMMGEGRAAEAFRTLSASVRGMLVLALGAQVVMTVSGPEIARVIYGGRISPHEYSHIGVVLGIFCLGLWAWSAQSVLARGFYLHGRTWQPTLMGTGVVLVTFPLYAYLGQREGIIGLAAASSVAITVYTLSLIGTLRLLFPGEPDGYGAFFFRALPATAIGIGAGLGARALVGFELPLVRGGLYGLVGGLSYLGACLLFRIPEVTLVLGLVARRLRRR